MQHTKHIASWRDLYMSKHFIPVKITDKQWADRLVQGEVFMRSLHEFGSWGNIEGKVAALDNDFRGDFFAGVTAVFKSPEDHVFFAKLPLEVKKYIVHCCLIDESDIQFFKIFSLYRYEYDEEKQRFIYPDTRMAQFGDTAVLITDFCEFIERYGRAVFAQYEKNISLIGNIEPFDFTETRYLNPLFCKYKSQSYQNELRMALGILKTNPFARGSDADTANELIKSLDPITLQLGDLSDITAVMPVEDFMQGKLPVNFKCRWPSNGNPESPSNYDTIVEWTKDQMSKYRSDLVKPTFAIA